MIKIKNMVSRIFAYRFVIWRYAVIQANTLMKRCLKCFITALTFSGLFYYQKAKHLTALDALKILFAQGVSERLAKLFVLKPR
jgi:hypothetical protein